ncbi:hypothetical protein [Blastococcus sp. SYSU DS1021]
MLLLSAGQGYFGNVVSGSVDDAAIDQWRRGVESTVEAVPPHVGSVLRTDQTHLTAATADVVAAAVREMIPLRVMS